MSWMDSWSRPSKSTQFPPPLYLTNPNVPYCHTCGRVISSRREKVSNSNSQSTSNASPVKYCSERCRRSKPGRTDRQIEDAFAALLDGDLGSYKKKHVKSEEEDRHGDVQELQTDSGKLKKAKGDSRLIVWCSDVETLVFGSRYDPAKQAGRRKNRPPRGVPDGPEWKSVDMESSHSSSPSQSDSEDSAHETQDTHFETKNGVKLELDSQIDKDHRFFMAGKKRPDQSMSEVNYSVGGERGWAEKIEETDEMLAKRREGQRRAEERELVRRAARRGVAFGFKVDKETTHKFETTGKKKRGKGGKVHVGDSIEEEDDENKEVRKRCEAVITKAVVVVEPSFAKGDWGIRWREEDQVR